MKKALSLLLSTVILLSAFSMSNFYEVQATTNTQSKIVKESYEELHNYIYSFGEKGSEDYYIVTLDTTYDDNLNKYTWKANHSETTNTYRLFCMVYSYNSGKWSVLPSEIFSIYLTTNDLSVSKIEYINYSNNFTVESTVVNNSFLCNQIPAINWNIVNPPDNSSINATYVANKRLNYFYPEFSYTLKKICGLSFHKLGIGEHVTDNGAITKAATYTATGIKTYTCTACGQTVKTETIPKLKKKTNPLVAKGKTVTVKYAKVKKKAQTVAQKNAFAVSKAQGKVTYSKASGNKKITVSKAGKITVKKGLKKGTYKVKVKVTAAGNTTYKAATKTVTVTIKVK